MESRRGSCTGGAYDKTIINQIMLRYRPIAPKPLTPGSLTGDPSQGEKKPGLSSGGRAKRKYVRIRKKRCKRERPAKPKEEKTAVTTLQLLPEMTRNEEEQIPKRRTATDLGFPIWMDFDNQVRRGFHVMDRRAVETRVTVECVTEAWGEVVGKGLEEDDCPGFVSDGLNRVKWVNGAYRRMVGAEGEEEVVVRLVAKEELPVVSRAFACRVRVEYTWQQQRCSQTLPCDVWRIDFVGFAWRLDVESALSLGR